MNNIIELFTLKVIRESGQSPITGEEYPYAEEDLKIWAVSKQGTYLKSLLVSKILFHGLQRRTFINGEEHFDEEH